MSPSERATVVQELALQAGFERVGIARAEPLARQDYVNAWLDAGRAGEMEYLRRWRELRGDPGRLLAGARSIVVVAHNYRQRIEGENERGSEGATPRQGDLETGRLGEKTGRVAQYAWG